MIVLLALLAPLALAQDPTTGAAPGDAPSTATPPATSPAPAAAPVAAPAAPATADPNQVALEDRVVVRDPKEVEAFKEAQDRFSERAKEIEADTRGFIDAREKEEREKLATAYDGAISTLDADVKSRRGLAIERFEQFLLRYPEVPYASHVRFRLADLYWEDAKEDWLEKSTEYYKTEEEMLARGEDPPEPPVMDLSAPVALYQKIIADNKDLPKDQRYEYLDGAYYSLGFVYKEENSAQYDDELARQSFVDLISVVPDSPLADQAHMTLGNFAFESNHFDEAIKEYRIVYDRGPTGPQYDDAVYQLAWAYYKLDVYDTARLGDPPDATALSLFTKLLDFSQEKVTNTGKKSDYAPDAIKFMAFSFSDISQRWMDADGLAKANVVNVDTFADAVAAKMTPTDVAKKWFATVGAKDYEWDVYVALADALTKYNRFPEAISVYRELQADPRWVNRPENPDFQMQVVKLYASANDLAASAAARIEMTEKYNDSTEWWHANRYNPEALGKARGYIESSLADVAIEYFTDAQNTGDTTKYDAAAEKFHEYLDKFPMSDDYYQMQWYLAYTDFQGKKYDEAIKEYESLIKSKSHHPFGDGSIVQLVQARQLVMEAAHGPAGKLPDDAVVERTYTTQWRPDNPINVYALSPEHKAFIDTADRLLAWKFTPPTDPTQPNFAEFVDTNYSALKYIPAQVLHTHQRFDESRPRLLDIIQDPRTKCTQEASFAAKLIVDSYVLEGDNAQIRKYTKEFILHPPGCGTGDAADPGVFANTLEGASFKLALEQVNTAASDTDHVAAAEAFLAFIKEFPKSEYVDEALYNAANEYDRAGKVEQSNDLYEQYVNDYPKDPKSAQLSFRIAANYESVFELSKAIDYYGRLLKNFPDDPVAPDAAYNVAFLKIGVGDHLGAARGFEDYERKYPDRDDAVEVLWQAGEQYEAVSPAQAITFYDGFRKKYGSKDPNYILECDYRISEMYKKQNNSKKQTEYLDLILKDWDALSAAGLTQSIKPEGRHYAAVSAFRDVLAKYAVLTKVSKLTGNEEKDAALLKDQEAAVMAFRADVFSLVAKYADFEISTAVLYERAMASLYYVDLGFQLKCPPGYNEDECDAYTEILEQQVFPHFTEIQDAAKSDLEGIIKLAQDKKLWSEWVDKTQIELNTLDPFTYPAQKVEHTGEVDSSIPTKVVPILIQPKKDQPAQENP